MLQGEQPRAATASILVMDDEVEVVAILQEWLADAGYTVYTATTGAEALRLFFDHRPDLLVLDILMPGMDGFQVLTRVRELSQQAVLVLSALASEESIVRGLNLGADEYLVKPVSRDVFLARVASLLRRVQRPATPVETVYMDANLVVDYAARSVRVRGQEIHLRPLEFRLLTTLVQNQNRMLTYQEILDKVWGVGEGSLDSLKWYVSSLRHKVEEDVQHPALIVNVRSVGYRYIRPPSGPLATER